jgi:hypothetical protein
MKECVICDYQGKDNWDMKRHHKRKHTPIECIVCGEDFTKHESGKANDICSSECSKKHKQNWSKEYGQKPERKEAARITQRKVVAKKKAEDPEWGLKPLIQRPCRYCETIFPTRGNKKWYCNKRCNELWKLQQLREATLERAVEKNCEVCNLVFSTNRTHQVCCSEKCRTSCKRLDEMGRLTKRVRQILRRAINPPSKYKSGKKAHKLKEVCGYTPKKLRGHIESLFKEGMTWDNYGEWEIDHIRPISSFNYTTTECEDFQKCWGLNNLQPLWAKDNMSKSVKWDGVVNA